MDWRLTEMDLEMDTLKRTTMTTKKGPIWRNMYATYIVPSGSCSETCTYS